MINKDRVMGVPYHAIKIILESGISTCSDTYILFSLNVTCRLLVSLSYCQCTTEVVSNARLTAGSMLDAE